MLLTRHLGQRELANSLHTYIKTLVPLRYDIILCVAYVPQDLVEEDVMILDTYSELFVWVGRGANEVEKREALKTACEYIQTDPSNRDLDSTLLIQVAQ